MLGETLAPNHVRAAAGRKSAVRGAWVQINGTGRRDRTDLPSPGSMIEVPTLYGWSTEDSASGVPKLPLASAHWIGSSKLATAIFVALLLLGALGPLAANLA